MRIVFIGGNKVSTICVKELTEAGHEVVIIETKKERIDELSEFLDCGFIHADGTNPEILKEVNPKATDVLICGTDDDHGNIISSLLAKNLEFKRVITMISNVLLEPVCSSLNLQSTIFSARTISDYIQELIRGKDVFEISNAFRFDLTLYSFTPKGKDPFPIKNLKLPPQTQAVWLFRKENFIICNPETQAEPGDRIFIACHKNQLEELQKQFES